jgi:transposase
MAIIHEQELFSWKEIEDLGDLERLKLIIDHMPDEKLMQFLEKIRYKGRNDYPIRAVWNSILAGIVYQHESTASLMRELKRNIQLREICGFSTLKGVAAIPTKSAYSRFLNCLLNQESLIEEIFNHLVKNLSELLPGFGKNLAFDGKALDSLGRK